MKLFSQYNRITLKIILFSLLFIQLAGCSHRHRDFTHWDDAAPTHQVDVATIENAKPVHEPRSRSGNPDSYVINGTRYHVLASNENYTERGIASWYGTKFHGQRTSSGETYNMYAMTAAHKTLPLPTYAQITNLDNDRSIVVKINDRGPFIKNRIIDLSYVAAQKLGITGKGTGYVEVKTINPGKTENPITTVVNAKTGVPSTSNLYLQVGIFNDKLNAESLLKNLEKLQLPDIRVTTDTTNKVARYRVRIGPVANEVEADKLIDMLAREGHTGFRIRID